MEEKYPMRINKYLAFKKYTTRRGADELIQKKRVLINGRYAVLGDKVVESDTVEVRSSRKRPETYVYYAYNKPTGVVTHSPVKGEKDIVMSSGLKGVFPVGRLDKDSHGLIILTNDGRITDRLLNPIHEHEKEYVVKVKDKLRNNFKEKIEGGLDIGEDEPTKPCSVKTLGDHAFKIILNEGKRHQIRRMCVALFNEVTDLERIRIMNIKLGNIRPNNYKEITGKDLEIFLKSLGL